MRLAALLALAVVAAGCAGGTKSGGRSSGHTVFLTIANHEGGDRNLSEYIGAVNRLSKGTIRLVPKGNWRSADAEYDRGTLADVRAGRVDFAKIAVRSYDQFGFHDLDALTAPFLVEELALQERLLESGLPSVALRRLRRLGVEGVTLLPGELERPFGLERRLVGPPDYRGAVVGITPAAVATQTLRALGAIPRTYRPGDLPPWRFTGAELDLASLEGGGYPVFGRSSVTANVVFWPRVYTLVGNPGVLAKLTPEQRQVLRRAGREAIAPAIARLRAEERAEAGTLCRRDNVSFVEATPSELFALRAAVRPVYAKLERNRATRTLVHRIEALGRRSVADRALRCPVPLERQRTGSVLDGTWEMTASVADVLHATQSTPDDAQIDAGHYRMVLRRGRVSTSFTSAGTSGWRASGVFSVRRGKILFRLADGESAVYRWNVYRDTLTLRMVPGVAEAPNVTFAPWHRVRD